MEDLTLSEKYVQSNLSGSKGDYLKIIKIDQTLVSIKKIHWVSKTDVIWLHFGSDNVFGLDWIFVFSSSSSITYAFFYP